MIKYPCQSAWFDTESHLWLQLPDNADLGMMVRHVGSATQMEALVPAQPRLLHVLGRWATKLGHACTLSPSHSHSHSFILSVSLSLSPHSLLPLSSSNKWMIFKAGVVIWLSENRLKSKVIMDFLNHYMMIKGVDLQEDTTILDVTSNNRTLKSMKQKLIEP